MQLPKKQQLILKEDYKALQKFQYASKAFTQILTRFYKINLSQALINALTITKR